MEENEGKCGGEEYSPFEPLIDVTGIKGVKEKNPLVDMPEVRLAIAVLEDAFNCLKRARHSPVYAHQEKWQEAVSWFLDRNPEPGHLHAFLSILDILNAAGLVISPSVVRDKVQTIDIQIKKRKLRSQFLIQKGLALREAWLQAGHELKIDD